METKWRVIKSSLSIAMGLLLPWTNLGHLLQIHCKKHWNFTKANTQSNSHSPSYSIGYFWKMHHNVLTCNKTFRRHHSWSEKAQSKGAQMRSKLLTWKIWTLIHSHIKKATGFEKSWEANKVKRFVPWELKHAWP